MKQRIVSIGIIGLSLAAWILIPAGAHSAPPPGKGPKPKGDAAGIALSVPTTATTGEAILVRVDPVGGANLSWVSVLTNQGAVGNSKTPPFEFTYTIPQAVTGAFRIGAIAADIPNDTGYTAEAFVQVTTQATLQELTIPPSLFFLGTPIDTALSFSYFGQTRHVQVEGVYSDGVTRDLSSPDTGTTHEPQDSSVIDVQVDGLLKAIGEGTTQVLISNSGLSATLDVESDFVDPNLGDRTGSNGSTKDLHVTYSGPIDLGGTTMPMPSSGSINLPSNSTEIRFLFHNNSGLPQLGAVPDIVEGSLDKRSDANCAVNFTGNEVPTNISPFAVVDGEVILSLPSGGGKCIFLLKIASAGKRDADKLVVNNPVP